MFDLDGPAFKNVYSSHLLIGARGCSSPFVGLLHRLSYVSHRSLHIVTQISPHLLVIGLP